MDAKMYHHILEDSLLGTLHDHRLGPSTIIFQHDNDPKHTARLVQEWLEHQNLLVLPWPPSSPDLNIIENVWAEIKKRLETYRPRPRNTEELWRVVQKLFTYQAIGSSTRDCPNAHRDHGGLHGTTILQVPLHALAMGTSAYLDIFMGDADAHAKAKAAYDATAALLAKNAVIYDLPSSPPHLTEEQQEILKELDSSLEMRFMPPEPLQAGRLVFELDDSQGLSKTMANFLALCSGEKGMCKNAPNKKLHYLGCPIHRIAKGFVAQGGDITRGDGSGGESIYGGKFNDDKAGLKQKMRRGSLAMANSGKNTNSSQFFVVLTDDESKLAKMNGKYVVFGQLKEGWEVLDRLDAVGSVDGKPAIPVWIGGCGKLTS
ncbi:hypothetical protein BN946_scf184857.g3, partial [Trametes cinnabarina]